MNREGPGLRVNARLTLPWREIRTSAVRSGGPGGQNVNKVASKVVLRFSVAESPTLGERRRQLLLARLAPRLTASGELVLHASRHRERARNEADALARLSELLAEGLRSRRNRRATRPTRASVERRLDAKRRRGSTKRARKRPQGDPE